MLIYDKKKLKNIILNLSKISKAIYSYNIIEFFLECF